MDALALVKTVCFFKPHCPPGVLEPPPASFGLNEDSSVMRDSTSSEPASERSGCGREATSSLAASGRVWAGTATVRTLADVASVLQILLDALKRNLFHPAEIDSIRQAVQEAILNAVKHGHKDDPSKQVRIRYLINHVGLLAQVEDEGPGFRPDWILNPRHPERQEHQGRGLRLMLQHMSEVRYNASGNCVTLLKHRSQND